ncbi:MAG: hypothetical protein AAFX99_00050 [Myxococcota bacterium]
MKRSLLPLLWIVVGIACASNTFNDAVLNDLIEQSAQASNEVLSHQVRIERELRRVETSIRTIGTLSIPETADVSAPRLRAILMECFNQSIRLEAEEALACDVEPLTLVLDGATESQRTFIQETVDTTMEIHYRLKALIPRMILDLSRTIIDIEKLIAKLDSRIDVLGEDQTFTDEGKRALDQARNTGVGQRQQLQTILRAIDKPDDPNAKGNTLGLSQKLDQLFEQMLVNLARIGVERLDVELPPKDR